MNNTANVNVPEIFGSLVFDDRYPQSREVHFAKQEKYERYLLLKKLLEEARG